VNSSEVMKYLKSLLSLDPYLSDFDDISNNISLANKSLRNTLLTTCNDVFGDISLRKDESARVACSKIIVSLIPDSNEIIRHWISTKSGRYVYEIHFSLFCFLDRAVDVAGGESFAKEIPVLIEKYLFEIHSDTAQANFMAGDLLGDHWIIEEALPILSRLAKEAKYANGRYGGGFMAWVKF